MVLTVMLGPFVYGSAQLASRSHAIGPIVAAMVHNNYLLTSIAHKAGALSAFLFYLRWRGWKFHLRIDWRSTIFAPLLAAVAMGAGILVSCALDGLVYWLKPLPGGLLASRHSVMAHPHALHVAWALIVIEPFINACYEEMVFTAYAFHQFAARRGALFAALVVAFLRMALHTYKGPLGMIGAGVFSLIFADAYVRYRRLWSLILAHALIDFAVFSFFKVIYAR